MQFLYFMYILFFLDWQPNHLVSDAKIVRNIQQKEENGWLPSLTVIVSAKLELKSNIFLMILQY